MKLFLWEVWRRRIEDGTGRIPISVRGSCSANRQQRLRCLQAETRILIWEQCWNRDAESLDTGNYEWFLHPVFKMCYSPISRLSPHELSGVSQHDGISCMCYRRKINSFDSRHWNIWGISSLMSYSAFSSSSLFPAVTLRSGMHTVTLITSSSWIKHQRKTFASSLFFNQTSFCLCSLIYFTWSLISISRVDPCAFQQHSEQWKRRVFF